MHRDVLPGTTVSAVPKEMTALAIIYHLVRLVMRPSATRQHLAAERISVLDALRWLSAPNTGRPCVALLVHPVRPHRGEPRVKKRRPKSSSFMLTPRQEPRQQRVQQGLRG